MSAKKKKNALGVCDRCQCYFLNRDFEKHPQDCQIEAGTSHIRPESAFVGTSCQVEKREAQLPSDAIGWTKYNTVLLNPNTIELLGVLPRTACVLSSTETGTQVAVIWPCAEINPLRICVQGMASERSVRLDLIRGISELKTLQLCPQDDIDDRLLSAEHFSNFLRVYLSGGFVSPDVPIVVRYLARTLTFNVYEDNVERLKRMNISSKLPTVYSLAHDLNVSFVENFR